MIINTGMRTDIPAFYSEWFMNRIREGYVLVRNPYRQDWITRYELNPDVVDCISFCTKNPAPMLKYIDELKRFHQYWFVTITPYGKDIEPNVSSKEQVMQDFYGNKVKLLVSTTVIEVGVNVPNASMMVIEHADRFGLAQLHQLRGRIGRGPYKSYCILVSEGRTENARERLQIMESVSDGFELAEEDLKLRGPGQFFGHMQHGLPDLKIADVLGDMDILLKAREAAAATLASREEMDFVLPVLAAQYRQQFTRITEL
jgi:RecG-like helicase